MSEITGKVVQPHKGFDIEAAHRIIAQIENKQGWHSEKNARYRILENGETVKRRLTFNLITPRPQAVNFERATGEKSAQRIYQERSFNIFNRVETWAELHSEFAKVDLRFEKKGSGAIVWVGDKAVKASSVSRMYSMGNLCKRFGEFIAGDYSTEKEKLPVEPVSTVNLAEWEAFIEEKRHFRRPNPIKKRNQEIAKAKERHKEERKHVINTLKSHGISILNIARYFLAKQQKEELQTIHEEYKKKPKVHTPYSNFETWLTQQNLHQEANKWRYRRPLDEIRRGAITISDDTSEENQSIEARSFEKYSQAIGASRYRVTCLKMEKDGSKKVFVLDKRNGESKGFTAEEMPHRLPQMQRLQNSMENIYYTPLSDDKHHILIDDMTAESLRRFKRNGYEPAVILESSSDNYQCILTIPKLNSSFDREIGNKLTKGLNEIYGDKNLSGCIHPHRAPGFGNFKAKYQNEDGSFPRVKLHKAEKTECSKAFKISKDLLHEYKESEQAKKARELEVNNPISSPLVSGSPTKAYYYHYINIRNHMEIQDFSRMDAMVALRMRATGHSPQAVFEAIQECAPNVRWKENRNWEKCAERTANYAFGVAGDIALRDYEGYLKYWYKIEHGEFPKEGGTQEQKGQQVENQAPTPRFRM